MFLPCSPPLLGSFLLCGITRWSCPVMKWIATLILAGMEFAMAMQCALVGIHYILFSQIAGLVLLLGKCELFIKLNPNDIPILVSGYRKLQISERIHNSTFRVVILPVCIFGLPLIEILIGFAIIVLFYETNWFQLVIILVLYLGITVFGLIILTFASSICTKTEGWLKLLKHRVGRNGRYWKRVHKSFRPLRLEFGNNYVDRLTPIVMKEFCLRQTASMLLLTRV